MAMVASIRNGNPDLKKYLKWSLGVHVAILLILSLPPFSPFGRDAFRRQQITWVNVPKGMGEQIGVGMKKIHHLPRTTIAESKKTPAVEAPAKKAEMTFKEKKAATQKKAVSQKDAIVKEKPEYKKKTEDALARLAKAEKARQPEAAQIPAEMEEGGVPFGSDTGPFVAPDDPVYVLYQAKIRKQIMDAWVLPLSLTGKPISYRCQIQVKIDEKGNVTQTKLEEGSGHEPFDQSAIRAIRRASPLDIPPEKLKTEAVKEGFLIEFSPDAKM